MKTHTIKTLSVLLGAAMLFAACRHEEKKVFYEPKNTIGLEELAEIAQDTTHYRAIIFTSPYCYGCRQSMSYTLTAIAEMDTSLWRVYYLIEEDLTDSAHWQEVTGDMVDIGASPNRIFHWRKPADGYGYPEVFALFRSIHPVKVTDGRIPLEILVDTNNYIALEQCRMKDNEDSIWYEPASLHVDYINTYTDYSVESGCYSIVTEGRPAPESNIVVIEK